MNRENLGWAVAGGLAVSLLFVVSTGFQEKPLKIGTVNFEKVFDESDLRARLDAEFREQVSQSENALTFMAAYPMLSNAELRKFRDVSLKTPQTDADKAEVERIRKAAVAADQKYRELQTKANATDAEKLQMNNFQKNVQENQPYLQRVNEELNTILQEKRRKAGTETTDKIRAAIGELASKQGYSIVFNESSAPYSSNDVTAEVLKLVNSKK